MINLLLLINYIELNMKLLSYIFIIKHIAHSNMFNYILTLFWITDNKFRGGLGVDYIHGVKGDPLSAGKCRINVCFFIYTFIHLFGVSIE